MQKVKKCSEFRVKALREIETIRLLASGFGISLSLTCALCTYLSINQYIKEREEGRRKERKWRKGGRKQDKRKIKKRRKK